MIKENGRNETLLKKLSSQSKLRKGTMYMTELVSNPNQPISCSQLRYLYTVQGRGNQEFKTVTNFSEHSGFSIGGYCYELPIEITDKTTIHDCYRELKRLERQEDELEDCNDLARLDDVRNQIEIIQNYISTSEVKGRIRYLYNKRYDDYRAVYKAINRTIQQITSDDPVLFEYINEHLQIGVYCEWREVG